MLMEMEHLVLVVLVCAELQLVTAMISVACLVVDQIAVRCSSCRSFDSWCDRDIIYNRHLSSEICLILVYRTNIGTFLCLLFTAGIAICLFFHSIRGYMVALSSCFPPQVSLILEIMLYTDNAFARSRDWPVQFASLASGRLC